MIQEISASWNVIYQVHVRINDISFVSISQTIPTFWRSTSSRHVPRSWSFVSIQHPEVKRQQWGCSPSTAHSNHWSCFTLCTPLLLRPEEKWALMRQMNQKRNISHYQDHSPLRYCAAFHPQPHVKHLFSGNVPWSKSICIATPATSFCIISAKLLPGVNAFMFAFQHTGRFCTIIIMLAPTRNFFSLIKYN